MHENIKVGLILSGISTLAWYYSVCSKHPRARRPNIQPAGVQCPQPQDRYIQLSKGRTFYRDFNMESYLNDPPIVVCHGFIGSSEYLLPLINSLITTKRRIIALDLYGRGHSDCIDYDYSYDLFTEQLLELLDLLKVKGPIDLVGYSMGGGISVQLASENLPRIRTLTLIAPVGLPSMAAVIPHSLCALLKVLQKVSSLWGGYLHERLTVLALQPDDAAIAREWVKVDTLRFQWYKEHMLRRLKDERATLPRAVASTLLNLRFDSLSDAYARIGNGCKAISHASDSVGRGLPVLVAWGENDKTVPCDAEGLRALVPQAQVVSWPGQGHLLPVELAEEVGEKLLAFWQQQEK